MVFARISKKQATFFFLDKFNNFRVLYKNSQTSWLSIQYINTELLIFRYDLHNFIDINGI